MFFIGFISADEPLCHALSEQFSQEDQWHHAVFSSLEDALAAWSETLPPLIVWDSETAPAKEDVLDFFAMRLEDSRPKPLVLVIGKQSEAIDALEVTEQLTRPLRLGYLLTRLQFYQSVLSQSPDVKWSLGPWQFEPRARRLVPSETEGPVKLTDKEVSLLEYLYAAKAPVSRDELLASVWGYDSKIDTHTLETHIYRLRKKLMDGHEDKADVFVSEEGGYSIDPSWRAE